MSQQPGNNDVMSHLDNNKIIITIIVVIVVVINLQEGML